MGSDIKWARDLFAEQQIKKFGVSCKESTIQMDDIDWVASNKNGARLGQPVVKDHVNDIALAMMNGDSLPMPVFRKVGKKLVIFAGVHRCHAAIEVGEKSIPAYVIETDDEAVIYSLPAALNGPQVAIDREARIRMAVHAVGRGMTIEDAASRFSLPAHGIRDELNVNEFRIELGKMNIESSRLPKTSLLAISSIKNHNVVRALAQLAIRSKLTGEEIKGVAKLIRAERTEVHQIAVVSAKEKEFGPTSSQSAVKCGNNTRPLSSRIRGLLTTLEGYLNVRTVNQWGFTEKVEKEAILKRIDGVSGKLKAIAKRG